MESAMKLSIVLTFMLAACAASQSNPVAPWRVEVATSGGLAGRGVGTYAIASDGTVDVVSMNGKRCSFRATAEELSRIERLLGSARAEEWSPSYVPAEQCCDRIHYELSVAQGESKRTVEWIDDPLPMPADLVALSSAIMGGTDSVRVRYGEQCR
jgi:hypothetical protein